MKICNNKVTYVSDNQNFFLKNLPIPKASDFYFAFLSCPLVQNIWSKSKCMLIWHPAFRHKTGHKRDSKTCLDMPDGLRCSGTNYGKLHRCKSENCKYKITITRSSKQLKTFFFPLLFCCIEFSILITLDSSFKRKVSFFEIKILDLLAFIDQFPNRIIFGKHFRENFPIFVTRIPVNNIQTSIPSATFGILATFVFWLTWSLHAFGIGQIIELYTQKQFHWLFCRLHLASNYLSTSSCPVLWKCRMIVSPS